MYLAACIEWLFAAEHPHFPDLGAVGLEYKLTGPTLETLARSRTALGL